MEQTEASRLIFERSRMARAIAAGGLMVMLADGAAVGLMSGHGHDSVTVGPVSDHLPHALPIESNHRITPRDVPEIPEVARVLSKKVSPVTYSGALLAAHGNLVRAEAQLISLSIPPMLPDQAVKLSKQLHLPAPTEQQQQLATQKIHTWSRLVEARRFTPKTARATAELFKSYTPAQEQHVRQQIVDAFYEEEKLNVHESYTVPTADGGHDWCNCGPRIDAYTEGHPEEWCADFASFLFKQTGLPLNGGETYGRPAWQLLRVHQNISHHPEYMSLITWFKTNGFLFSPDQRTPGPGDLIFIKRPNKLGQVDNNHALWHVEVVLKQLQGSRVLTGGGNTGNAVRTAVHNLNDPRVAAFGSLFPER